MARLPESARMAEKVEKRSGLPFPKASKVTPATFWSRPRSREMVQRFGEKKSDAVIPSVENRKKSQTINAENARGRREGEVQKYRRR